MLHSEKYHFENSPEMVQTVETNYWNNADLLVDQMSHSFAELSVDGEQIDQVCLGIFF